MRFPYFLLLFLMSASAFASTSMANADSLFQLRDKNFNVQQLLADSTHVNAAIQQYHQILQTSQDDKCRSEALWKLLQAYYFKGQFCTLDKQLKKNIYDQGLQIGEKYVSQVPQDVAVYSWMGIIWARWAEVFGLIPAARKGVANKVKFYGEQTLEMDPNYLDAGAYRLLGMLNFSVPKIPFILPWPSKEQGLAYLEKANSIAPDNLYNKMYLAEVLYETGEKSRAESLLLDITTQKEIVHDLAIDSFIKHQAKEFLEKHY